MLVAAVILRFSGFLCMMFSFLIFLFETKQLLTCPNALQFNAFKQPHELFNNGSLM